VYPGIGWVVWRDEEALPEELVFRVDYLGGDMPTFTLNFSRPGSQIAAQYYNLIRLGFEGYAAVQGKCREVAQHLASSIGTMDQFECLTDGSELPAFAFKLRDDVKGFTVYDVSMRMREADWIVPAYKFPANREDLNVLRVVVRNGFSRDLADLFLESLDRAIPDLERQARKLEAGDATSFHH
jgi:glutamate decarboxylase